MPSYPFKQVSHFYAFDLGEAQILWSKNSLYQIIRHKKPFFMPAILLSPSSHFQKHPNPTILMDAKQLTLTF